MPSALTDVRVLLPREHSSTCRQQLRRHAHHVTRQTTQRLRRCCAVRQSRTLRAPEKSRTSTRRFTGPLHYRCATGAKRRAGHGSRTHRDLCGAQICRFERPAWWCRRASTDFVNHRGQHGLRPVTRHVGRVGFEPTLCPGKNRVQSCFASDPLRGLGRIRTDVELGKSQVQSCFATNPNPCKESHPLESNQNLSGFSRARRPTTQEWDTSGARAG